VIQVLAHQKLVYYQKNLILNQVKALLYQNIGSKKKKMNILLLLIIISSLCVILSKNMIQSVLYLIIVYFLGSLLFIYLGADFIGLILLIVYIGAIAVLFLFVIMMLNVRILEIYSTYSIYLPLAVFLSIIFIF